MQHPDTELATRYRLSLALLAVAIVLMAAEPAMACIAPRMSCDGPAVHFLREEFVATYSGALTFLAGSVAAALSIRWRMFWISAALLFVSAVCLCLVESGTLLRASSCGCQPLRLSFGMADVPLLVASIAAVVITTRHYWSIGRLRALRLAVHEL